MKVVALVSGGMDSTTTAARLVLENNDVFPLFIDYGQLARERERHAASEYVAQLRKRCKKMQPLQEAFVDLPFLRSSLVGTTEIAKTGGAAFSDIESKKIDWVPARNIVLLSIAASYCETVGARSISIGAYKEDQLPPYPDSSREFFDEMQEALTKGMYGGPFRIVTPFGDEFRRELVVYSAQNGLPIDATWSCYDRKDAHCGECRNCDDRKRAFAQAGVADTTVYVR